MSTKSNKIITYKNTLVRILASASRVFLQVLSVLAIGECRPRYNPLKKKDVSANRD
ncbi:MULTISPECIES: hypothetical protein [Legionella]|uniref:hypothetical protein n=1 Tax=Legionella TaxID=445 RepID=UPI0013151712|nr:MULTISPECIES: hypothetical protein [Legionella]MCP0913359.1 hypothetical protein [Legionella sp. 27cVA30]